MGLNNLNLNLLVHLDALLAQRGVSGAAEQLDRSQPTVSSALARLRRHFGDDLLRRRGSGYELTPLAVNLRPLVADAIAGVERAFMNRSEFDPKTSRREFVVATADFWLEACVRRSVDCSVRQRRPLRYASICRAPLISRTRCTV
jgi:DNA-binding transcriptional LysR family regulator